MTTHTTPPRLEHSPGGPPAEPPPTRKPRSRRAFLATGLGVLLAAGGGTAWALDRFVIDHVQISDVTAYEASAAAATGATTTATATDSAVAVVTATSYTSDTATIDISKTVTGSGDATVTYFAADVVLTDATRVRSAFANNEFGENIVENTSVIAKANDAVFAINGDYYGFRDTGIVIRNGVAFRDSGARTGLAFYRNGTVEVYDETATTAADLVANGVWNTLSFGPAVLIDGQIPAGIEDVEVDTNFGNHSIQGEQPRTAVGFVDTNHLLFVVVDGRSTGYSAGVTMTGLAQIMQNLGATTAYNIDGGGSSTMYFNGSLVNNPLGKGDERGTSDILYLA